MTTKVTLTTDEAIQLITPIITDSLGLDFPNQLDIKITDPCNSEPRLISNAELLASKKILLIKLVRQVAEDLQNGKLRYQLAPTGQPELSVATGQPKVNMYLALGDAKQFVETFFKD